MSEKQVLNIVCVAMRDSELHGVQMPIGVGRILGSKETFRKGSSMSNQHKICQISANHLALTLSF